MTIAGWVPSLLDTLETSEDSTAFETYVRQDSVLLAGHRCSKVSLPRSCSGTWRSEPFRTM